MSLALSDSLCAVQCLAVISPTEFRHLCHCIADASASDFRTVQTQAAAAGCKADVLDLTPGTQYRFQVYAVNSQGASPASSIGQSHSIAVSCDRPWRALHLCLHGCAFPVCTQIVRLCSERRGTAMQLRWGALQILWHDIH